MKNHCQPTLPLFYGIVGALAFLSTLSMGQTYDTISNWDNITQNWYVSTPGSEIVPNPAPDTVNASEHCFKVVSGEGMYDYLYYNMPEAADFDGYPRYRIKILAPPSGGKVALKFENYNNTFSHEIVMTPIPGQWTDLVYDFSGLSYNDLTRMVIFPDFQGTAPGIDWYIDDVLKEIPAPLELESNLPIVVINTFGVSIPNEPKISGHMGIIDHGPAELNNLHDPFNHYDGNIGIETRGQSSQQFPKKSYAFETRDATGENLDVALLGMPSDNDWVLYAPYSDKSMLRNEVSFATGHAMGNYCSRQIYCEVVVNNDYKGVYVLMEKIKKGDHRVDIATLKPNEISGDDLTGGYILRVDKLDPNFTFGVDGWRSDPVPPYPNAPDIIFQFYYPQADEIVEQQRNYIRDFITTAENTLTSVNFKNPDQGYQKYYDVPSFIDFMLLCEISKEVDKYKFSTYFYKEKESDGGKLFAGPAWDFDLGYGNVDYWPPGIDYTGWLYQMEPPYNLDIMFWWKRLMEDPYFRDMAKARWVWLRQNQLTHGQMQTFIDSVLLHIDSAKDRNYQRWPILGQYVWPNYDWSGNTYADEVEYFENFLFNRLHWMDNNMPGTISIPWAEISSQSNTITLGLYGDYFRRRELKKSYFQLQNAPDGVVIQDVAYINANQCLIGLSANVDNFPEMRVTVCEEAINYWIDITSNPLGSAGSGNLQAQTPEVALFEENNRLHIRCNQPEWLPESAEIVGITGQSCGKLHLEPKTENILPHQLRPGLYLMVFKTENAPAAVKFSIVR